jgi:hypothetical protein
LSFQGAEFIIFPELATTFFHPDIFTTRETLLPYLHDCPDPKVDPDWIPCDHPTKYPRTYPLYRLSCMARVNHIWVGAGTYSTEKCSEDTDSTCPEDERFIRNTAVFFDRTGRLAFRYYKTHLFFEETTQSNIKQCENDLPIFETEFARFGVAICYDSAFSCPTVDLVEKAGVRNIVFPTMWVDISLSPALIWQQGIAAGLNINFIASNLNAPGYTTGSGIYSGRKVLDYTYNGLKPLLIAKVPNPPAPRCQETASGKHKYQARPDVKDADDTFYAWTQMFGKQTKFTELKGTEGSTRVCEGDLCCTLTYKRTIRDDELYVFGAASGHGSLNETDCFPDSARAVQHKLFVQMCVLQKCPNNDLSECGIFPQRASTTFQQFEIFGNFSSPQLYPGILTSGLAFAETDEWDYSDGRLWSEKGTRRPLVAARVIGRNFEKDDIDPRQQ